MMQIQMFFLEFFQQMNFVVCFWARQRADEMIRPSIKFLFIYHQHVFLIVICEAVEQTGHVIGVG